MKSKGSLVAPIAFKSRSTSVGNTAKSLVDLGFQLHDVNHADVARITVENTAIRFWETGDVPISTEGHPGAVGETFLLHGSENLLRTLIVSQGVTSVLQITLLRVGEVDRS